MEIYFIHIPKCGGTSVKTALDIQTGHQPLAEYVGSMGNRHWEEGFWFSFVRNPFDRLASLYRFTRGNKEHGFEDKPISFKQWFYLTLIYKRKPYYYKEEYFQPCYDWLTLTGAGIDVDFVGKLESIEDDIHQLGRELNIKPSLSHLNKSTKNYLVGYSDKMVAIVKELFYKDLQLWYPNLL